MHGFRVFEMSQLLNIPSRGLWSIATVRSLQPRTNILAFSKDHATASASPSVGEYQFSVGVVKEELANTSFQLFVQQTGAFSSGHSQYFWNNKYPIPDLLQSV